MAPKKKYSLWLRPQGDVAFSLKQRIEKMGNKYSAPVFEPHVTLLGALTASETELSQLTDTLASSLHPFDIILTKADIGSTFYQCIFVRIQKTDEVMNARKISKHLFSVKSDDKQDHFPHLSLMYGEFPREKKERILNAMGREFHTRLTINSLLLVETSGMPQEWQNIHSAEFTADD